MPRILSSLLVAIIASISFWLGGCSDDASTVRPPKADAPVDFPEDVSTVTAQVSLDLAALQQKLNSEIPSRLLSIDENRDACVPAQWAEVCILPKLFRSGCAQWLKTNVTPAIDCHLDGRVDRGQISLTGAADSLVVSMPIDAAVTVKGRGAIGKNIRETARGSIVATAKVKADITEDWKPVIVVDPSFAWDKRANLRVLGIEITIGSKIEPREFKFEVPL